MRLKDLLRWCVWLNGLAVFVSPIMAQPVLTEGGLTEKVINPTGTVDVFVVDGQGFGENQHGTRITATFNSHTEVARLVQLSGSATYTYENRTIGAINAAGLIHHSLVLFVSDNGGQLDVGANNGPLRAGKGTVYEGGLRIPAIASWPQNIASNSMSQALLTTMDIYPTLLEAANIKLSHVIDGISFLPTLMGKSDPDPDRILFFSRREGGLHFGGKTIEAVRWGPWKLLQNNPYASLELYHLINDPLETMDLSSQEPDIFRQLATMLREYIQMSGQLPWQ